MCLLFTDPFAFILWHYNLGSTFKTYLSKLKVLQNKAMRAISGVGWSESATPLYQRYEILKVEDMYKLELAKFMHSLVSQSLPPSLINYFADLKIISNRNIRSKTKGNLKTPLFKSSKTQNSSNTKERLYGILSLYRFENYQKENSLINTNTF